MNKNNSGYVEIPRARNAPYCSFQFLKVAFSKIITAAKLHHSKQMNTALRSVIAADSVITSGRLPLISRSDTRVNVEGEELK